MNKDTFQGRWGKLTDDDITQINGSYEEMEGKIQKAYGYQKEEAREEIKNFLKHNGWEE
jgi:uncharacterized protein YjbJ (UPF0337 family)